MIEEDGAPLVNVYSFVGGKYVVIRLQVLLVCISVQRDVNVL